ncbi:MAG: Biopolymer transport protein ExbD [Gammaproteobacteria bacterium]|nr:Biopolymer transport protein ExbD [Gammaproteobacteria bacterium]
MKFSDREEDDVQINLTPLIDVVFLLLIFFMVSTTFSKESELRIQLPESSDEPVEERRNPVLEVEISAEGAYAVKGPGDESAKRLLGTDRETLYRALVSAGGKQTDLITIIRADRQTPHVSVVRALDIARRLGHTDITFATQQVVEEETGP